MLGRIHGKVNVQSPKGSLWRGGAGTRHLKKRAGASPLSLGALNFNNVHNWEHYGNLVTYMRIKNVVPPSSEEAQMPAPKQEKPESQRK
jgi:hypothetical protein